MVEEGKINIILGGNASGKTSLLKNLYNKDKEAILYLGNDINFLKKSKIKVNEMILKDAFLKLDIPHFENVDFSGIVSTTEKRKFILAFILSSNKEKIFLDDPLLGLDRFAIKKICRLIRYIKNNYQKTFYITSVKADNLYPIADNIIMLHQQGVIFKGSKEKFFKEKDSLKNENYLFPEIMEFINIIEKEKKIKLGNIDNNSDLMKAIYQNTKY